MSCYSTPRCSSLSKSLLPAMNSSSGLDRSCVAAAAKRGKSAAEACTAPEDVAPHIQVILDAIPV